MSDSPHVLIVSQNPELDALAAALEAESITSQIVGSFADASQVLESDSRGICVIDSALPSDLAVQAAQLFSKFQARRTVILADPEVFTELSVKDAAMMGVDLCPKHESLAETVLRLKAILVFAGYDVRISGSAASAALPVPQTPTVRGEVIVVFSVKGGVGKTTIAVNVAAGLAQLHGRHPLLVDANLYFGDVPVLLDIAPRRSIFDLGDLREIDSLTLKNVVTEHKSGVSILSSPPDFTTVESLSTETLVNAVSLYRAMFDYIIVDTRTSFDEGTLQLLDVADRIALVTTPEVGAVHQTARFLAVADAMGYKDRLLLILNRAGSGLGLRAVEEHLGASIAGSVVSAGRTVVSAANRGIPILLDDPDRKERVTRDLTAIVDLVRRPLPRRAPKAEKGFIGSKVERLLRSVAL